MVLETSRAPRKGKALLLVLDGCGLAERERGNAVTPDTLPWLFETMERHGYATLAAAGEAVGLEAGQVGNSEAGHLTLGAGHVVACMSRRILRAFEDGSWAADEGWRGPREAGRLHVIGLLSDAGVHALARTLVHATRTARAAGVARVVVHPVLDGVDSKAGTAPALLDALRDELAADEGVELGVVIGRRWFCDRSGDEALSRVLVDALRGADALPPFDAETLTAHLTGASEASFPAHRLAEGGALPAGAPVLITSHRADRARQVVRVLAEENPIWMLVEPGEGVPREHVFFPQEPLRRGLPGELLRAGLASRRIAERCKFPHVTFFFNGFDAGREGDGVCLPSIPEAEIRDRPAMSAAAVTDEIVRALEDPAQRVVVANLANLDQVGHLGDYTLARRAAGSVEQALRRIAPIAAANGWTVFVTGDHGNADVVEDEAGRPHGSHTDAPVPLAIQPAPGQSLRWDGREGSLANVAASLLEVLGLDVPSWMEPPLARFVPAPSA